MQPLAFVALAASVLVSTPVPQRLVYQGRLIKSDGTPVTGSKDVVFAIYDQASAGTPLWTETQTLTFADGYYATQMGSVTALPGDLFMASPRYLALTIDEAELSPRQEISAVAYAMTAINVAGGTVNAERMTLQNGGTLSVGSTAIVDSSGRVPSTVISGQLALSQIPQGTGSNLDADKLDGLESSVFALKTELSPVASNVSTVKTDLARFQSAVSTPGAINSSGNPLDWSMLKNVPPAIASGGGDTGCPGPRINGVCVLKYDNTQATNFQTAAQICATAGGDLCTDTQSYPLSMGYNDYYGVVGTLLSAPHWTASFADNDAGYFTRVNGGTGDDHGPNSSYGYACCGGTSLADPRVPAQVSPSGVKYVAIHDVADTYFSGAIAYCSALRADVCSDSQTFLLRKDGLLSRRTWTNSHSDNDANLYAAINGNTDDNPSLGSQYGFACCPSLRPFDLSCPVSRTSSVCAVSIHNVVDSTFADAASACAKAGADLCSIAQAAVLRVANVLDASMVWTNSHSDNDGGNASVGVGPSMPDNPVLTDKAAYACCIN